MREEGDEVGDNDNEDDDVLIVLLPPPLLLLSLSLPMSLSCGKLLSSSSSPAPWSLPVILASRSTISLMVILRAVSCPNPLRTLPPAAMNNSSSSNNGNDSEIFRAFIDIY